MTRAPTRPDVRLYLVTDPLLLGGRDLAEVVLAAVEGGATLVQLRDKRASDEEFLAQAARLQAALAPTGVPLLLNDRVHLAARLGLGAHVGPQDLAVAQARALLGPEAWLGVSLKHPLDPIPAGVDYIALGPAYTTQTKTDTPPPQGVEPYRQLRARTSLPFVAIGGISASNLAPLAEVGVDGVAVVSAIMGARDPRAAARGCREAWERASFSWGTGSPKPPDFLEILGDKVPQTP
jgi:thiamine-phosphate pyrophosphorylase